MNSPKKIKLNKKESLLEITWNNGKEHKFPLQFLRDESPDAGNKGETILWRYYEALPKETKPGMYEVEKLEMVGSYALQITWKDGYDYGIYSWELLTQFGDYLDVKNNLHQDFDHDHHHHHKDE